MIELALHHGKEPLSLKSIENNQGISKKYLTQLMSGLKLAGLVVVTRGKRGGYKLARHPTEINMGDILCSVEGDMSFVDCVKDAKLCDKSGECFAFPIWNEFSEVIKDYLKSVTLADVVKKGILSQVSNESDSAQ